MLSPFDPLILDRKRTLRLFGRLFQLERIDSADGRMERSLRAALRR